MGARLARAPTCAPARAAGPAIDNTMHTPRLDTSQAHLERTVAKRGISNSLEPSGEIGTASHDRRVLQGICQRSRRDALALRA
jgi:hypothetical protein